VEDISVHRKRCEKANEKFGRVLDVLDKLVEEGMNPDGDEPNIEILDNVEAIFKTIDLQLVKKLTEKRA
jgi:hypothetical protein